MKDSATPFLSGKYKKQYQYNSFTPEPINKNFAIKDQNVLAFLSEADRKIGELNAYSRLIPDIDFFIHMHITKESVKSGRIEGTKTEFDEALMEENEIQPEKRDDWQEISNYTRAMNYAVERLKTFPLSIRLLKETHAIMLSGTRGEKKLPGEIRKSQNWIGGSSLKDAFFIPPHQDDLMELISDLEKFLHNDELRGYPT
jgi:Fic family protein